MSPFIASPRKRSLKAGINGHRKNLSFAVKGKPIHHPYQTLEGLQRTPLPSFGPCFPIEREIGSGALATSRHDSNSRRRGWRNFVSFSQPFLVLNIIAMPLSSEMNPGSATRPFRYWKNLILPFALPTVQAFLWWRK